MRNYERFKPLEVQSRGLPAGYQDVRPGDCVVAFTRRHIYDIKHRIEIATGYRRACSRAASARECRLRQCIGLKHLWNINGVEVYMHMLPCYGAARPHMTLLRWP